MKALERTYKRKELCANYLSTMIKESLKNNLRTLFCREELDVRSGVYDVIGQVMLYIPHTDITAETLDAHIAMFTTPMKLVRGCPKAC